MLRNNIVLRKWPSLGRRGIGIAAALLVAVFCANTSKAALVYLAAPPASVLPGALESKADLFFFEESSQVLAAPLAVDISTPGVYAFGIPLTPGVIPAGTNVKSYFFHRDTIAATFATTPYLAISPTKILGIIVTDGGLDATDSVLGNAGTAYPTGTAFRGLDITFPITPDSIVWGANGVTIAGILHSMEVVDQFRVIVLVPEPATCTMLGMAACALGFYGWRRRKTA